jgi:hypothetical protein
MSSLETKRRLEVALASTAAASEVEGLMGGFLGAKIFYVHSVTGSDTQYDGLAWDTPFATLDYAIGKCTADKGDVIIVRPGHAETTTAIAADVAGIRIIGLGRGRAKPAFTATTAATDLINVSAANVLIANVRLVGAASGCTALLDLNAADFEGVGIVFEHGAAPLMAVTVVAAAHRFQLVDCQWRGTAAGPDCSIDIEGKVNDWAVIRPRADYSGSAGLDLAFLRSSFIMKGYRIENPIVVSFDVLVIDINSSSAAVGDGLMTDARCVGSGALTIANVNDVGGMAAINCQYTDAVTADGTAIPAATAD